jgi:hypothetical protein
MGNTPINQIAGKLPLVTLAKAASKATALLADSGNVSNNARRCIQLPYAMSCPVDERAAVSAPGAVERLG